MDDDCRSREGDTNWIEPGEESPIDSGEESLRVRSIMLLAIGRRGGVASEDVEAVGGGRLL